MVVAFAGMMSGLTLGLMSMSLVDLEVLAASGNPTDRLRAFTHESCYNAAKIISVVKRHHLVLCTLLISNATAMEIIPQSICSRYGLAIGAAVTPLVRVLVWVWFPVAYPISKVLDWILGKGHASLFRRAELKTLVDFHGNKAGKGGSLSLHETTIIGGALELTSKTARDAMTPLSEAFSVDIDAKLDKNLMDLIIEKGYSRVPVYYDQPANIIGALLVKNLMTINPADCVPIKNITLRLIPRRAFNKFKSIYGSGNVSRAESSKSRRWSDKFLPEVLNIMDKPISSFRLEGEVIGIITMEDVMEELINIDKPKDRAFTDTTPLCDILNEFQKLRSWSHSCSYITISGLVE
ncbi:hypothetical protein CTI12_AA069430 [Artemisia annua]|uniref:CNNM transmembrane domain-containing protein n=1 Tax=Artemisia annua TaxID=35608 RepID=A0A2U1Q6E6_ARTAN|nr:hypothetical protein CTI12_AA069430 [Artemisia annua]